jgi:hypothetical protein
MSAYGHFEKYNDFRYLVAIGCEADIRPRGSDFSLLPLETSARHSTCQLPCAKKVRNGPVLSLGGEGQWNGASSLLSLVVPRLRGPS